MRGMFFRDELKSESKGPVPITFTSIVISLVIVYISVSVNGCETIYKYSTYQ